MQKHPKNRRRESLLELGRKYNCDKCVFHNYLPHYEWHLKKLRNRKLNILEIGIGGYQSAQSGGSSLKMWRDYFAHSNIFGIDIEDKSWLDGDRIKTFRGSQDDEEFLLKVCNETGPLDIVIDDGSHINRHVIASFKFLFPRLKATGIYVVEDIQTSYWGKAFGTDWGGSSDRKSDTTTMGFFKSLTDGLNYADFMEPRYQPTYFDKHIVSMSFYHNLIFIQKGLNNEGSPLIDAARNRLRAMIKLKE
jgi:hypothetical protein